MATTTATALRDLLLATERAKQPLDAAIQRFSEAAANDARLLAALLDVSPQAEPLVANWPDETGKGSRWEDRESIARFLELVTMLLHAQAHERSARDAAEALALKIVREKSASLEKMLSWSDKPIVEFRVLELMATIVSVSAACAREFVRIFNFQSPAFTKLATRRFKKAAVMPTDADDDDDASPQQDGIALSTTKRSKKPSPELAAITAAAAPSFQIREVYVRLVASLAACPDKSVHRFALKDGGVVASLFKSLDCDDAAMLAVVMEHLETLVLRNENVDSRGRTAIFNNTAMQQLVAVVKSDDEDVANQAWLMLSKLFFEDRALYQLPARQSLRLLLPKSSLNTAMSADVLDVSSVDSSVEATTTAVKMIRNVIGSIGLNEYIHSGQVRVMVNKFLREYPGLTAEFVSNLAPQLEPKTGYRWFCVASMVQNVLSTPLEAVLADIGSTSAQAVDSAAAYSAPTLASRLIMPLSCRKELSRGLQHASSLVVHSVLGLVECALRRFQFVQSNLPAGISRTELENEFRFLLPSPETLVSLLMKLCSGVEKAALVYLRALTVFRLYLECLPLAMSESKADFTKLLAWQYLEDVESGNTSRAMRGVIVGEILRVLMVVDETRLRYVVTSGNVANGEASKLSQLLRLYLSQSAHSGDAGRSLARAVLFRVFVALKVFGSGTDVSSPTEEIGVWLENMVTGGDSTTAFVETILQDLLSDPFSFLSLSTEDSVPPSPATLALIAAAKGTWPLARSESKLKSLRQEVAVAAFVSRVLMSLMCCSSEPAILGRLLSAEDDSSADAVNANAARSTKKRRRSDSIDLATATPYQCVLAVAQTIVVPTTVRSVRLPTNTPNEWKPVKNERSFGESLFKIQATSFVHHFPKIVEDLLRLRLPSHWLHHYIGARPDVDLIALTEVVNATAKKDKLAEPVLRGLLKTLPLNLISQRILFALCVDARSEKHLKSVEKLIVQLNTTLNDPHQDQWQSHVIALVVEQLLHCVEIVRHTNSTAMLGSLFDVLLRLQVILGTSGNGDSSGLGSRRILGKLHRATTLSVLSSPKLSALDLIAMARIASDGILTNNELLRLRQRGSSVTIAVLARNLPVTLRLEILNKLLKQRSSLSLIAHITETLGEVGTISEYKEASQLSQRMWDSLVPTEGVQLGTKELRVLSAGLHIVARLGGVPEAVFQQTVPASWARYLSTCFDRPDGDASETFDQLVQLLRRLSGVLRHQDTISAPSRAYEELIRQVLNATYTHDHGRLTAMAVVLVATYGSSYAGATHDYLSQDQKLIGHSIDAAIRVQLKSPARSSLGLIVLRHAVVGALQRPVPQITALVKALMSVKQGTCLSTSQVLALLLSFRQAELYDSRWSSEVVVFLLRSTIAYASEASAADKFSQPMLQSLHLMIRDLVQHAPSEGEIESVASKVASDVKRFIAMDISSDTTVYFRFVRASRVVSTFFSSRQAPGKGYSAREHFDKLTSHTLFASSLRDPTISVELLRAVASLIRLGGADLCNRTVFQQLLAAYDVSLSLPDRIIRSLLDEFESKAGILASQYGYRFGLSSAVVQSHKQDGSVRSDLIEDSAWLFNGGLEPARVRATVESFPLNRSISVTNDALLLGEDDQHADFEDDCAEMDESTRSLVYDPSYLLPMLSRYVSASALPEAPMIQQGVVGLALRAVSSNADDVREYAYAILAHVHEALSADAATDFKPGRQVHLMLDTLRNALQEPLEGVSSIITVFMNDTISILSRPGHTMYPHVNHFLLARPAFDLSDVPMFYSLFNSHSPQTYKQERSWLLHGLRRGVREDADVSLLIRRHVPSILLSFFGSDLADDHTQLLVCSILAAMLKTDAGAQYLLTKCAFLEWLTARFHESASTALPVLNSLSTLLEESLKTELWDHLDAPQHQALGSAAANSFEALVVAMESRRAFTVVATKTQMARIARGVLQCAPSGCSLTTYSLAFGRVIDEDTQFAAMDCVDEFVTERLLTHNEFQKARFAEWSELLSRVARILSLELRTLLVGEHADPLAAASDVGRETRAANTLVRLRHVLAQAPTLKLLVLETLANDLTTSTLLQ